MNTSVAVRTTTEIAIPNAVASWAELAGLTPAEAQDVAIMMIEHRTNLPSIRGLMERGFSLPEVSVIYRTRDRLNVALESHTTAQGVPLRQLASFLETFRCVGIDTDTLTEQVLAVHTKMSGKYLSSKLQSVEDAAEHHPDVLPETLAAFLAGDIHIEDDENLKE